MAKYISESALVAEIERRKQVAFGWMETAPNDAIEAEFELCDDILSFIDSLEVKEVDLELNSFDATVCKIGNTYLKEMDKDAIVKALEPYKNGDKVKVIIKAQKGEEL